ncbi:MAG: PAS domain-containing protein [Magnetococcus sp. WYHC-3]
MKLSGRLAILTTMLVVLTGALNALWVHHVSSDFLEQHFLADLDGCAHRRMEAVERFVRERVGDLQLLATSPMACEFTVNPAHLRQRLVSLPQTKHHFISIAFFDEQAQLLADSQGRSGGPSRPLDPLWHNAWSYGQAVGTLPPDRTLPGRLVLAVRTQCQGSPGAGVLLGELPLSSLGESLKLDHHMAVAHIELLDGSGQLLHASDGDAASPAGRGDHGMLRSVAVTEGAPGQPSLGWRVELSVPRSEAVALSADLMSQILLATLPLVLLGVALAWIAARSLLRPLYLLNRHLSLTERGQAGPGESIATYDELGAIAHHFQNVHDQLLMARGELVRAKERLELVLQGSGDGCWDWDITQDQIWFDERWLDMLGWRRHEVEPTSGGWKSLLHPDDMGPVFAMLTPHLEGRSRDFEVSFRMLTRTGAWKWILGRGKVVERDPQGRPLRMSGTHSDIDAAKQAEARLAESENLFRTIFSRNSSVMLLVEPSAETIVAANDAACAFYGYPMETLVGMPISRIDPQPKDQALLQRHTTLGQQSNICRLSHGLADGSRREVEIYATPVQIQGRALLFAIVHDITHRIAAEVALEQEHRRLENILEATGVGTWEWNVQTGETRFNTRWAAMAGYSLEELAPLNIGTWERLAHPEDLIRSQELLQQHFAGSLDYYECEVRMRHKDGHWVWVLDRGRLVSTTAQGQPQWMAGTHTVIDQLKQSEERLREARDRAEQASRAKGMFLANMSHEIRTPMNAILGMTELLAEQDLGAEARSQVQLAHTAGEMLLSIINDILDLAKIEAGQLQLEQEPVDLPALVDSTLGLVAARARDKGLILTHNVSDRTPRWVSGDALRLRQVLLNLLGNAVKFTSAGTISVSVQPAEDGIIVFSVQDSGIGIPPERLETIFDSFSQGDTSISRRYGGTGLGLTISRHLVAIMGGTLSVTSLPGQGSTFTFTAQLPMARPGHVGGASLEARAFEVPLQLLVAEDTEENRILLQAYFKKTSHHLVFAHNGLEAVERFKESRFDLILMDIQMPELDGLGATRAIRALERERNLPPTPVLALTAYALKEEVEAVLAAGCNGHLSKPISRKRLMEALNVFGP